MLQYSYSLVGLVVILVIVSYARAMAFESRDENEASSRQFEKLSVRKFGQKRSPIESNMILDSREMEISPLLLADKIAEVLRDNQENDEHFRFDTRQMKIQKRPHLYSFKDGNDLTESGKSLVDKIIQSFGHQIRTMHGPLTGYKRQSKYFGFSNPYLKFVSEDPEFWDLSTENPSKGMLTRNSGGESTQFIIDANYRWVI